ncbi:glycoside hydrolase family 43 protein [Marinoscillum furvescens]|uniref:Glycosyl hydrolase family 43 n=1 Tax=Marinoscillum furvescens DSM 4134 TaxID=1122208 RepID=A0A3D9KZD7_MARFU|nr:glycoside hydrolase family 43 protein [Marinoscillum furvescens]RED95276.1 glycosyl hydrolase family 43 [Marinoscillum furvescens DSM 4134]
MELNLIDTEYIQKLKSSPFSSFILVAMVAWIACSCSEKTTKSTSASFTNPVDVAFGDPFILDNEDGNYYMYGTGGGAKDGFATYSSSDLVHWKFEGQVYTGNTDSSWNEKWFWAPEVYKRGDKYYLFFSAQWKHNPQQDEENFRIGVAVADSPTGPFLDMYDRPIFDPGYPIIDANVYFGEDGTNYLYYSRACSQHPVASEVASWAKSEGLYDEIEESWIYGVKLKPDFSGVEGEPVLLLRPPVSLDDQQAEWESRSVTSGEINRRWTEGSFTFKWKNSYYIMYSANYYAGANYAVGYATGPSPLGPFIKASNNPVLQKNVEKGGEVTGTGHNMVLFSADSSKMYTVYHARTKASGQGRVVFIDSMHIDENGQLVVAGPTTEEQTYPEL